MKVRASQLKGSNSCFNKREKPLNLSDGKNDNLERIIFQKRIITNWFRALSLRGREDETRLAITLINMGEPRENIPSQLLYVYDSVKSILRADGRFDLRTGSFDETKAFVITQLACRMPYVAETMRRNYEQNFFFDTKRSGKLNGDVATAQVARYLLEEKRSLIVPEEITLDLFGNEIITRPDLCYIDPRGKKVEAIKIRTGKPDVSPQGKVRDRNILNNKELYAIYAYARHVCKEKGWPAENASGSYYFLRKEADRSLQEYLEPGFFEGCRNMKHIATLSCNSKAKTPQNIDDIYEKQFEDFVIGEACSGDDCEKCERYELCHFAEAPLKNEVERHEKSLDDLTLSPAQEKVAHHRKGIMRCNAGAGSGKTTVVALNTAFMIAEGIDPKEILLITFSNAGAGEMKDRTWSYLKGLGVGREKSLEEIQAEIAGGTPIRDVVTRSINVGGKEHSFDELTVVTFNEFGQNILNTEFGSLGFTAPPRPIDATERATIIARLLDRKTVPGLHYKDINMKIKNFKGARLVTEAAFDCIKRERLSIYNEEDLRGALSDYRSSISDEGAYKALLELYEDYDEELRSKNLIEFADQEAMVFEVLDLDPYYFDKMGYKHIIIDECQDTSKNQLEIIKTLLDVSGFESLLVVGDDSQAIYEWRNADASIFIDFSENIEADVEDVNLVENHRSTPEIIEFANAVNAKNTRRVEKDLIATRPSGKPVVVKGFHKVDKEYNYIVDTVKEKISEGYAPEDIAILTFTKKELAKIAGYLTDAGIESSLQAPQFMLDDSRVQGICSLAKAYRDITATRHVLIFMNCLEGGKVLERAEDEINQIIESGQMTIRNMWYLVEPQKSRAFRNLIDEIAADDDFAKELASRLDRYVTVDQMIDYIESFGRFAAETLKREGRYSGVVLSTAHSSKGLEWPVIINSVTHYDKKDGLGAFALEEHRRLLFVSSTRARDELYITGQIRLAGNAEDGYSVNRFIDEAASIAEQPLDYFDEEGRAERELQRAERRAAVKKEKEEKAKKFVTA